MTTRPTGSPSRGELQCSPPMWGAPCSVQCLEQSEWSVNGTGNFQHSLGISWITKESTRTHQTGNDYKVIFIKSSLIWLHGTGKRCDLTIWTAHAAGPFSKPPATCLLFVSPTWIKAPQGQACFFALFPAISRAPHLTHSLYLLSEWYELSPACQALQELALTDLENLQLTLSFPRCSERDAQTLPFQSSAERNPEASSTLPYHSHASSLLLTLSWPFRSELGCQLPQLPLGHAPPCQELPKDPAFLLASWPLRLFHPTGSDSEHMVLRCISPAPRHAEYPAQSWYSINIWYVESWIT